MGFNYKMNENNCDENFDFIRGRDWQKLDEAKQDEYIESAFNYWRERGFPHNCLSNEQIKRRYLRLEATKTDKIFLPGNELQASFIGLGLANYFHPQMWSTKCIKYQSPMECFMDDATLKACIRKSLILWPDRYGASPSILRKILGSFKNAKRVSNFRPAVAKALIEKYSSSGSLVLDFSAGYGGRLLGCMTLDRHFVGYDPCKKQIIGLKKMVKTINSLDLSDSRVDLLQVCAEDMLRHEPNNKFHLIITSPPYFNIEWYSEEDTQSYVRYPTYAEWREKFLNIVIRESYRVLKPNGYFIVNIANINSDNLADDAKTLASAIFKLDNTFFLRMGVLPFQRKNNGQNPFRHEPVYVFKKIT